MNFVFTEEQLDIQQFVRSFAQKEVVPLAQKLDRDGEHPQELYQKAFDLGLHCVTQPEELGGPGFDTATAMLIMEELGKACPAFADILCANALAAGIVLDEGTEEQKKRYFQYMDEGKVAAFALTEPGAGSDAGAVATTARREGDEYVLNGTKCFVTNGAVASIYTIIASVDRAKGVKGLTAFIVERDRPGVSVGKSEDKMGLRCSNTAEVILEDVRIPVENLIGKEGSGFKYAMRVLDVGRLEIAAICVGLAQAALDHAITYAKQRRQFGQPISDFQAIRMKIADMAIGIETARWMAYRAACLQKNGQPFSKEAAMAKCYASDVAMKVSTEAVQIMGGYGYSKEYPVEKLMRDAKIMQIFEGTNEIQRTIIAGQLLR